MSDAVKHHLTEAIEAAADLAQDLIRARQVADDPRALLDALEKISNPTKLLEAMRRTVRQVCLDAEAELAKLRVSFGTQESSARDDNVVELDARRPTPVQPS